MVANRKVSGTAMSLPAGLGIGILASGGMTLLCSIVAAWLVSRETVPESSIGYVIIVILLLSSMLGAWTAVKKIKRQRMVVCMLSGACYFLLLIACTALFFGGQYSGMGVTALVILAGSAAMGLMGLKREGGVKRRNIKHLSR